MTGREWEEMMKAIEADGEKLRALTGKDHAPWDLLEGVPTLDEMDDACPFVC